MGITDSIINYRRFLKRKNYSNYTVRNYMNTLKHFIVWLKVPVEQVTPSTVLSFIDHLLDKRLTPKTVNCYLDSIRGFYEHLIYEENVHITNPVKRGYALRLSNPLPRYIRDEDIPLLFAVVRSKRDRAIFMLMLRCGLRVEEVAKLTLAALDLNRLQVFVYEGKGAKDRVVYLSHDAHKALVEYLKVRPCSKVRRIFLVEKGRFKGKSISVRGIQKRMEKYAQKSSLNVSCHQLRHTMATQLLNADADLATIQDLLGHTRIKTTQRYCRISNLKVQRDYHKAIKRVAQRHAL